MGKGVKDFEELDIFKKARILVREIYKVTNNDVFKKDYGLKDQIRRAGISVMSNIAEGFDRGSKEFKRFLRISRGSCMEVRSQLIIAGDLGYITENEYKELSEQCKVISAMIKALMNYLETDGE